MQELQRIFIASDHAGFTLKEELVGILRTHGYAVNDMGAHMYDEGDDYPDFIQKVAMAIREHPADRGIILGGSGQGEAITANRFPGVRAVVYYGGPEDIITLSRSHNNANILSLGARFLSVGDAEKAVLLWLSTPFSSEPRHIRRIEKIDTIRTVSEK